MLKLFAVMTSPSNPWSKIFPGIKMQLTRLLKMIKKRIIYSSGVENLSKLEYASIQQLEELIQVHDDNLRTIFNKLYDIHHAQFY